MQNTGSKYRDLEERTFQFARQCGELVKKLPRNIHNIDLKLIIGN